jgi:hypothetical protein
VNHAVVAELLHGARRERGFYGGLYGTRVAALVTGHACLGALSETGIIIENTCLSSPHAEPL